MNTDTKRLFELCTKFKSGGTPRSDNPAFYGGDILFVTIDDMTSSSKYLDKTTKKITDAGLNSSNCWKVPANSILYSIYATLGVARITKIEVTTNQAILALVPDNEKIDTEYLYYYLSYLQGQIHRFSAQTTQSNLNAGIVKNFPILYVAPKEQVKIAEVLATIDRAIAQTEVLIAKHQRIKTGLMQDLLTHGIDEHGQLRDPSTHRFKSTPLGMVPEEWKVTTLGKIITKTKGVIQTGPFGTQLHAYDYVEDGIPTMMPQDIDETGWIDLEGLTRLTPAKALELKRHALKENDVIFARRGELSKCSAISNREEGWICGTDFMLVRVSASVMLGEWFAHYYRNDICQRQVMAQAVGSIMKGINTPLMSSLIVALPNVDEQKRILDVIDTKEKIIKETVSQRNKLLKTKQGLMQDLLSGRVSVKVLMEGETSVNTDSKNPTKEEIDAILNETQKENLLILQGNEQKIIIGVPHHAPLGVSKLPNKDHPATDENAGFLGAEVARLLGCNCIIACNATKDPNKKRETDYSQQIHSWEPNLLVEIHGHGGGNRVNFDIEISGGSADRNKWSLDLEERLKKKMIVEPLLKDFTVSGDFARIGLKATKSYTITAKEWIALHIELPKKIRETPEIYLPFCKVLAESVSELMNGEKQ